MGCIVVSMLDSQEPDRNWAPLDNAGKLYPSLVSSRNTTLFRISALLDKPVHAEILQRSIERMSRRFPYFQVHLQRGAFWYFFVPSEHPTILERDSRYPCTKMPIRQSTRLPFRIRAFKNRFTVEFSHILTDGTGGLVYFQALLTDYLKLREGLPDKQKGVINFQDPIMREESEDAFQRYHRTGLPLPARESRAYKIQDRLEPKGVYHIITGSFSLEDLKKASSRYGVTLTEFLTALLMEVYQDQLYSLPERKRRRKAAPIRICVPVNLRRFFPSRTMRNFFLSLNPVIDPRLGRHSFEEICGQVKHFMALNLNTRTLEQQISRNLQGEKRWFIRILPCWLKDRIIPGLYRRFGESAYSTVLSNLGQIRFPDDAAPHIRQVEFIPNPPEGTTRLKMGVITYGDRMTVSFGRISRSSFVEREFFRKLRKRGIIPYIDSNIWKED